ncbi:MAG: ATP-binding protein [Gaiellaceae bacterium]
MSPLRSVGARLAAALALVIAVALGVEWYVVVPSLERNLTRAKGEQLENRARILRQDFPVFFAERPEADPLALADWVAEKASLANARVVVLTIESQEPMQLSAVADSRHDLATVDIEEDPVAASSAGRRRLVRGTVSREGQSYVEVALPVRGETIVLFSSSLEDTLASVEQVKRRLLLAGGVALGIAILLGFGAASVFARRIRRLERAADRIAGGRLDEPVVVRGRDELGQLAAAFEHMRVQLARLDHARREFIANASHELRTPIFSLGGFLELMASEDVDEETRREFTATMQEQLRRLEKLATALLDLSRLDAGQLRLELGPVDVSQVAEALAEEFAAVAKATSHSVDVDVADGRVEALADETRTLQIGRALLENAIRHTPGGTGIRVAAERRNGRVVLAVEDHGPGIPAEQARQVFERFYRAEGAQHASGGGLGLAIARELAAAMGGRVELESEPGRTVFRLELPAVSP